MKYEKLAEYSNTRFRRITGVKRAAFEKLVEILRKGYAEKHRRRGRTPKLSIEDLLLATLEYLREYRTYAHIAASYLCIGGVIFIAGVHFICLAKILHKPVLQLHIPLNAIMYTAPVFALVAPLHIGHGADDLPPGRVFLCQRSKPVLPYQVCALHCVEPVAQLAAVLADVFGFDKFIDVHTLPPLLADILHFCYPSLKFIAYLCRLFFIAAL